MPQNEFKNAAVFGASGAIGRAFCQQLLDSGCHTLVRLYKTPENLPILDNKGAASIYDIQFDIEDSESIQQAIDKITTMPDLVVVATGWLHDETFQPEKTFKQLNAEHLQKSWRINFLGPSLLLKELFSKYSPRRNHILVAVLSARVGSISDNRMGGWHSYRTAKAALNMMIKNFSIELERMRSKSKVVALQPGTTDSKLSKPFQKHLAPGQLQTADYNVACMLRVLHELRPEQNGELIDFAGNIISP